MKEKKCVFRIFYKKSQFWTTAPKIHYTQQNSVLYMSFLYYRMFDNETKERSKKFEALVNLILLPGLSTEHIDQEIIDKLKSKGYLEF